MGSLLGPLHGDVLGCLGRAVGRLGAHPSFPGKVFLIPPPVAFFVFRALGLASVLEAVVVPRVLEHCSRRMGSETRARD
eukprot:7855242-Pyramimonas_sp.AAC.1